MLIRIRSSSFGWLLSFINIKLEFQHKAWRSKEFLFHMQQTIESWKRRAKKNKTRGGRKARETWEWCGRQPGGELWSPFWCDTSKTTAALLRVWQQASRPRPCTPPQHLRTQAGLKLATAAGSHPDAVTNKRRHTTQKISQGGEAGVKPAAWEGTSSLHRLTPATHAASPAPLP